MDGLMIFNNKEFGQIRTVEVEGKIYFVASDVARDLGYARPADAVSQHCRYTVKHSIPHPQNPDKQIEVNIIPEGDMYRLITHSKLENAERFESWVFDEVIPSIRKNGYYENPNLSTEMRAILMIDQKQVRMEQRMDHLENDIPLYGSEADELSSHVRRKGVSVLGGKAAEAYRDHEVRRRVYRDIYDQIKREFGLYDEDGRQKSYKAMKRKYIADAHELIDCYEPPKYLAEIVNESNAQMRMM